MSPTLRKRVILAVLLSCLALVAGLVWQASTTSGRMAIALLLPDDVDRSDPRVRAWVDAAREEGLPLEAVTASSFLRPFHRDFYAGVIMPDSVHAAASDVLLERLTSYTRSGGKLMVVFDAGTLAGPRSSFSPGKSRLSGLVGIDYALYDDLRESTLRMDQVIGNTAALQALHMPPGKFFRQPGSTSNSFALSGYLTPMTRHPHFVTRGAYGGQTLLMSSAGDLIAGVRAEGRGEVLYVNLPLGYLKTRTDGLLLHSFLRYFGVDVAGMPSLSAAPDGRGGLVLNLHVDAAPAMAALSRLKAESQLLGQGPYSIHVTAGPDLDQPGDRGGVNLSGNAVAREWLKFFARRGDQVGSHGGWIHNYFGANVERGPRPEFEQFLRINKSSIENVIGRPVTEYSAPLGSQPQWVTDWLDEQHIGAYYFTGNAGMGPTRTYRANQPAPNKAWAFPVQTLGPYASFEEMRTAGVPGPAVADWLVASSRSVSRWGSVRLVYAHPPGILHYLPAVNAWMAETAALASKGKFRWYTMTDVAAFLDQRERVQWTATLKSGELRIAAAHPVSLARQAWRLPVGRYARPVIIEGQATLRRDGPDWLVVAGGGKTLELSAPASPLNQTPR